MTEWINTRSPENPADSSAFKMETLRNEPLLFLYLSLQRVT